MHRHDDTIVAPATSSTGALSVVRISGKDAFEVCDKVFSPAKGKKLSQRKGYTIAYGNIVSKDGAVVDDVLAAVFRAPSSYTGEDSVEISCHGSSYIVAEIIRLLIGAGARSADAGEFTARAFLAGRMDLSQAEAVADIISSHDRATHALASTQMRGGYSADLAALRAELLKLTSLLELELDFSEEDVTFADRCELGDLIGLIILRLTELTNSFSLGNAIKEGVPVAIAGSPNAGKSTLLNTLLKDDRAMVSDIPGTTRDVIEEQVNIGGTGFRFIDTAGIRNSSDALEQMGIQRTFKAMERAKIILYIIDIKAAGGVEKIVDHIPALQLNDDQQLCIVLNKCDDHNSCRDIEKQIEQWTGLPAVAISAKFGINIVALEDFLCSCVDTSRVFAGSTVVSNARHYEALLRSKEALERASAGLNEGTPTDLLAQDIRESLHWLGTITGEITTDEVLGQIFSKFCIGK